MASRILGKSKIAAEYIKKFNGFSKSVIAEKIYQDNPLIFSSKEDARFYVRYMTRATGESKSFKPVKYKAPKSQARPPKVYHLGKEFDKILWISDIHFPNHDETALEAAVEYGEQNEANCIVIGGDLMDNTPFTRWDKKPDQQDARGYFSMTYEFLFDLRMRFPEAKIIWLAGNHDTWYEKFLVKNAPMLWSDPYFRIEDRLQLSELEIEYLHESVKLKADSLYMLHGHTMIRGVFVPVNGGRGLFMRAKTSAMIGHVHQSHEHTATDLGGNLIACWTTGCLCTLSPDYDPHNTTHNQGFAFIRRKGGKFHVDNIKIYNGEIL